MFAACSVLVIVMAVLSMLGVFEFGDTYTAIVLVAGLIITVSPMLLIRFVPPYIMKYLYADNPVGLYRHTGYQQSYRNIHNLCACPDIQLSLF